jgi:hypothetical protein
MTQITLRIVLDVLGVLALLGCLGYLSACAGGERWLSLREWWGK